jgi:integrase
MTKPRKRLVAPGIWQLKTDLFLLRVRAISPHTGKMEARKRLFQGSKSDARSERERLREEIECDEPIAQVQRETLEAFARSWLSTRLARADLRESTAQRYAEGLDLHILPALGAMHLDALTPRLVETAVTEWAAKYKPATVNGWLRLLRTLLREAQAHGLTKTNAALAVRALRERGEDDFDDDADVYNALAPNQVGPYLHAWRALYPEHHPLIATLLFTGLRWGEATALMWTDLEAAEETGVLRVRRSQVRNVVRNTTKTGRRRMVPFPQALAQLLRDHRTRMVAEQHPGLSSGWVFPNDAGKPRVNGSLSHQSQRVRKHAGITQKLTIHGLRRTATDLLRRAAVDPVAAKAIIGHTTDRMREHYSSMSNAEARDIGDRVLALVPGLRS